MSKIDMVLARIEELEAKRSEIRGKRASIVDTAVAEKRGLTEDQQGEFDGFDGELRSIDAELVTLNVARSESEAEAARETRAAGARIPEGHKKTGGAQVTEPSVYRKDNAHEQSYFRDLARATLKGDRRAAERLDKNSAIESRALTTTAGAGGEFAPPEWLVNEYVRLARAARVAIDLFDVQALPSGISSINLPRVATGVTVATQTAQNTGLSNTDITTNALTTGITTVGGAQQVSLQLLEQSGTPFDRVIMEDLTLAYAAELTRQSHDGSGTSGQLRGLTSAVGKVSIAFTTGSPTAGLLFKKIADAMQRVHTTRFLAADAIIMHPRRWAFLIADLDSTGRPLAGVVSNAGFNVVTEGDLTTAQGLVGNILGVPVYVDATIPTNRGAGTNEDVIYVVRRNDIKVWEGSLRAEAFNQTFADTTSMYFRLYNYSAMIPDRYGTSVISIGGTGLVTPTF